MKAMTRIAAALLASLFIGCGVAHADPQIIVNPDGSSDLYNCEEDSPPPCVWDCARMGNHICGINQEG
jgi:hypothetical protein